MNVAQMAWRNVWRTRKRSLVTMSAMSLALFIMIIYSGLVEGYMVNMRRNILDLELGEIQVHTAGYKKSPSLYKRIEKTEQLTVALEKKGFRLSSRLLGNALGAAGAASAGIQIRGIDVSKDALVSRIHEHVLDGQWLSEKRPKGVVIGRRLARSLHLKPGAELVVLGQAADGSMANDVYVVDGILKGITDWVDRAGVYMHEAAFRELFVVEEGAHEMIVRTTNEDDLESDLAEVQSVVAGIASKAESDLGGDKDEKAGPEVMSWKQLLPSLASMFDNSQASMMAMYLIFYLAIGMVILNAMLMAVFERVREFGVLKAIGASPFKIVLLILTESSIQSFLAILLATALSIPALMTLETVGIDLTQFGSMSIAGVAFDPIWRAELGSKAFTAPILTLIAVVGLAVVYPCIKAALISPAEAMRHR